MKLHFGYQGVLTFAICSTQVFAQSWNPIQKASGWARVDKDGSIAFYDPTSKKISCWMRESGILGEVDVSKLEQVPEKWVVDYAFNVWVVSGRNLYYVEKTRTKFAIKLPYEVGDLTWDAHGFYLSYKTPDPFIEMRDYDSGNVVWSIKNPAMKEEAAPVTLHRVVMNEDKILVIGSKDNLQLDLIDRSNGKVKGQVTFSFQGKPAPNLTLGAQGRGAIAWWLNKNISITAVPASQLPALKQSGLLLAMENLATSTVHFFPTGLSEQHTFIGIIESEAVFIAPAGGLVFIPINTGTQVYAKS